MFLDDAEEEKNLYDFDLSETEKSNQIDESKKKYEQKKK